MRYALVRRWGGLFLLAGWVAGSTGCIHNHYYGQPLAACDPATGTATTQYGAVCEVPAGSVVVSQSPSRVTTVGTPSRVVINSDPVGPRPYGRSSSRYPWRNAGSVGVATSSEGGINADDVATQ